MSTNTEQPRTVGEDLPKETIIIVGCVCGGVVIILTIVLVVLCCKRNKAQKDYDKRQNTNQMYPVIGNATDSHPPSDQTVAPPVAKGVDNPGLDQVDMPGGGPDNRQGNHTAAVFSTDTSKNLRPVSPYNYDNKPPNGHIQGPNAEGGRWLSHAPPPVYDSQRSNTSYKPNNTGSPVPNKNVLYLSDPYASDPSKDRHNESGMSTPDPQKPKKVIYEVVV